MRFSIGDTVIVNDEEMDGDVGRIFLIMDDEDEEDDETLPYLVEFPTQRYGTHDAVGRLPGNNGRWFNPIHMTKVVVPSIEDDPEYSELFI